MLRSAMIDRGSLRSILGRGARRCRSTTSRAGSGRSSARTASLRRRRLSKSCTHRRRGWFRRGLPRRLPCAAWAVPRRGPWRVGSRRRACCGAGGHARRAAARLRPAGTRRCAKRACWSRPSRRCRRSAAGRVLAGGSRRQRRGSRRQRPRTLARRSHRLRRHHRHRQRPATGCAEAADRQAHHRRERWTGVAPCLTRPRPRRRRSSHTARATRCCRAPYPARALLRPLWARSRHAAVATTLPLSLPLPLLRRRRRQPAAALRHPHRLVCLCWWSKLRCGAVRRGRRGPLLSWDRVAWRR